MIYATTSTLTQDFSKTVRLGEWNAKTEKDCIWDEDEEEDVCNGPVQDILVKSFITHPDYSKQTIQNDIGMIKLSQAANFKQKNIGPICLPFAPETQTVPTTYLVIGWGRTHNASGSDILQKAAVDLYDQQECMKKFSKNKLVLSDGQFCAGGKGKHANSSSTHLLLINQQTCRQSRRLQRRLWIIYPGTSQHQQQA